MSRRRRLLLGYLLLLALSHLVGWWRNRTPPALVPPERALMLPVVDGGRALPRRTRLVYCDFPAADGRADAPVLLLIHGSPGSLQDFDALARILSEHFRVVVPDLPGFRKSRADLPDYSIAAHAHYLGEMLDELDLARVHLVAFSMGGGVALELAHHDPRRVASISMVSAIGVQEFELFGTYSMNHLVHGFQLALCEAVEWLFPHFGSYERAMLSLAYARNFYDSDQRPLREELKSFRAPMSILHGDKDFLVPPQTAEESHRLVPQSELHFYDGSHFLLWTRTAEIAAAVGDFVTRVQAGTAPTRAEAAPGRIAEAALPFDPGRVPPFSGLTLFLAMLLIAGGTLISEDLSCIGAGLLVAQGRLPFAAGVSACFVGIFVGDVLLFLVGRLLGRAALRRAPLRWMVREEGVERASAAYQRHGFWFILVSRLMPGLRLPTYFAAGLLRTSALRFALYFAIAGMLWTPFLVGISAFAGEEARGGLALFQRHALGGVLLLVLALLLTTRILIPAATWSGRRRLLGWARRWRHAEFWPMWAFYPPLLVWIAWLALRYRSLTLVTAVNPGIPTGGLVGESKAAILEGLGGRAAAHDRHPRGNGLARWLLLPAGGAERMDRIREWMRAEELSWPLAIKPDVGERGRGVQIAHGEEELGARLAADGRALIAQEFVRGPEFGVFWLREPGADRGRILSITEKRLPEVIGDGHSTLERLILADPRAVALWRRCFAELRGRLEVIPAAGERVRLVEVGTHARGAIFLDGRGLETPELAAAIEELAGRFQGFHFGRFDLRAPSVEDFRAGRGLKVIELNGLTSEATHIYDPRHGVLHAWAVLCRQWSLAFRIAAANRAAGARPARLGEILRAWRR